MVIEDINLYYQPVPDPITATMFFIIMAILFIIGVYLHLKLLDMLKRENGLLNNVTKTFVIANIILWKLPERILEKLKRFFLETYISAVYEIMKLDGVLYEYYIGQKIF